MNYDFTGPVVHDSQRNRITRTGNTICVDITTGASGTANVQDILVILRSHHIKPGVFIHHYRCIHVGTNMQPDAIEAISKSW
jgi:hypothetical protein